MPDNWKELHAIADKRVKEIVGLLEQMFTDAAQVPPSIREALMRGDVFTATRIMEDMVKQVFADANPELARHFRDVFEESAFAAAALQGGGLQFNVTNPEAVKWIQRHSAELVREIEVSTREALRRVMIDAFQRGYPIPEQVRRIRNIIGLTSRMGETLARFEEALLRNELGDLPKDIIDRIRRLRVLGTARQGKIREVVDAYRRRMIRDRALTIARTETIRASAAGQQELWRQGVELGQISANRYVVSWIITPDDRLCERCRAHYRNYRYREINGVYGDGVAHPPLHPKCLTGDSKVGLVGDLNGGSKRWFDGDIFVVRTASGKKISCTGNHPILTDGGWVPASGLDVGSKVVTGEIGKLIASSDHNDKDVPMSIEEVFESIGRSGGVGSVEVPVSAPDFHGDGKGSDVAIIRANDLLLDQTGNSPIRPLALGHLGPFDKFGFALVSQWNIAIPEDSIDHASGHGMDRSQAVDGNAGQIRGSNGVDIKDMDRRSPGEFRSLFACGHIGMANAEGFGPSPDFNPVVQKDLLNAVGGQPVIFGEPAKRQSVTVKMDDVVSVDRSKFAGHIYNLDTEFGFYLADGIITHNCRCAEGLKRRRRSE